MKKNAVKPVMGLVLVYGFLIVTSAFTVFPVLYALLGAFKTNADVMTGGAILPREWIFTNYRAVWEQINFARYTLNSIYISSLAAIGSVILCSMTGYCLARKQFIGKKIVLSLYLSTMFIAVGALNLRPLYLLMVELGLHNSLWGIILIHVGTQNINVFLVSRFISTLPKELDEAATIDGCGTFQAFWHIIMPLIKPILGVVALFTFRGAWNDYIMSSVFTMTRPELRPLTVGVIALRYGSSAAAEWHYMLTGASISIIPMLIIYLIANKTFISGVTAGSVKG